MPGDKITFLQELNQLGLWGYIGMIALTMWAGTVRYFSSLKKGETATLKGWSFEVMVSGFVGVIAGLICEHYGLGSYISWAIIGLAAHTGTRSLYLFSNLIRKP